MFTLPPKWLATGTLALGVGLAYFAVTQVQAYVEAVEAASITEVPLAPVVTFAADLPQGHVLTKEDLRLTEFAASSVPPEAARDVDAVVGNYLERDVLAGDPVRTALLSWEPVERLPTTIRVRRGVVVTEEVLP